MCEHISGGTPVLPWFLSLTLFTSSTCRKIWGVFEYDAVQRWQGSLCPCEHPTQMEEAKIRRGNKANRIGPANWRGAPQPARSTAMNRNTSEIPGRLVPTLLFMQEDILRPSCIFLFSGNNSDRMSTQNNSMNS